MKIDLTQRPVWATKIQQKGDGLVFWESEDGSKWKAACDGSRGFTMELPSALLHDASSSALKAISRMEKDAATYGQSCSIVTIDEHGRLAIEAVSPIEKYAFQEWLLAQGVEKGDAVVKEKK